MDGNEIIEEEEEVITAVVEEDSANANADTAAVVDVGTWEDYDFVKKVETRYIQGSHLPGEGE